jgi:hypothetical protein
VSAWRLRSGPVAATSERAADRVVARLAASGVSGGLAWAGHPRRMERAADRPRVSEWRGPQTGSTDPRAACASSLRQVGGGVPFRPPSTPLARPAEIEIARERNGVRNAPNPTKTRNGNVNADVSTPGVGLGPPATAVTFGPLGDPAKAVPCCECAFPVTVWRQLGDIARTVRFPDKWDNALLAIAKGLMP